MVGHQPHCVSTFQNTASAVFILRGDGIAVACCVLLPSSWSHGGYGRGGGGGPSSTASSCSTRAWRAPCMQPLRDKHHAAPNGFAMPAAASEPFFDVQGNYTATRRMGMARGGTGVWRRPLARAPRLDGGKDAGAQTPHGHAALMCMRGSGSSSGRATMPQRAPSSLPIPVP
jgi:hypothetical protein